MAEPGGSAATSIKERKLAYPTEAHEKADDLLARIAATADILLDLTEQRKAQADLVDEMFKPPISARKQQLAALIKALEKLMKVNRYKLFDGTDRVDLTHGALLFSIEDRVRRAKDVLKRLEESGAEDAAFIVTKAVNWEHLETWSDERLIEVGTERKSVDIFSWEIFGGKPKPAARKAKTSDTDGHR